MRTHARAYRSELPSRLHAIRLQPSNTNHFQRVIQGRSILQECSSNFMRIGANDCAAKMWACRLMVRANSGLNAFFMNVCMVCLPMDCTESQ
jgi:hypothetical protein